MLIGELPKKIKFKKDGIKHYVSKIKKSNTETKIKIQSQLEVLQFSGAKSMIWGRQDLNGNESFSKARITETNVKRNSGYNGRLQFPTTLPIKTILPKVICYLVINRMKEII